MQLIPQIPTKSLQLGHLRQSLIRKDVDTFKANLSMLFQRVEIAENNNEREENMKNLVSDFLRDTYYKGTNEINTRGNYDLVIHQDLSANSPISVIVEVKRPSNNAEMISERNPNTKALQELLHYFLQESFIKGNKEVKHLIVTNIYEWYILDAKNFEKVFSENTNFIRQYKEWNEGRLGVRTTEWLYSNLLNSFITNQIGEITCAYIHLQDYKEIVQKTDEEEDKKLISLYKIFSPAHLLKYSFANDANTLNTSFYFELLHILGLEEVKESGKKIIQRKKKPESGSLIENVLQEIIHRKRLDFAPNLKQYGDNEEEQFFSVALELCITWLNRILFLKLLEGQMIKYSKNNLKFLHYENIKDFDELNELFFDVLAIPVEQRNIHAKTKFSNLPYLNSSLFDETELEANVLSITGLKNRLEMNIYAQTVLKDARDKKVLGKKNTLEYLFHFLNSYDFSGDSEEIQSDNKTLINSAVLGLIFEKINGYKDGSFFTPAYITMYMCRETIRKVVVQKFNEKYNWKCEKFEDLKDNIEFTNKTKRKEANEIVNSVKICDPSVGSGHFLVSALNELVAVKSELKILSHRDGSRIIEYSITVENDEIIITDAETNKPFSYRLNRNNAAIPSLQIIQEAIFSEKKIIIENCLFGVDINPKSVAICRLRLWIELLKNMYYVVPSSHPKGGEILQLETLPNIDINIKWGNSLISRFGLGNTQNLLPKDRLFVKKLIDDYKIQVIAYKSVKDWSAKNAIRQQIARIKSELEKFAAPNDKDFAELRKKEAELGQIAFAFDEKEREKQLKLTGEVSILRQKYTEKLQTLYKNTLEWRFDFPEVLDEEGNFVGFDVVVANPPYGVNVSRNYIEVLESNYETYYGRGESYILFIEMANKILRNNGLFSFIIPDTLLNLSFTELSRKYILKNTYLSEINLLPSTVFSEATVDTILLFFEKTGETENFHESDVLVRIYAKKEKLVNMDFPRHTFSVSTSIWHQQGVFNLQILENDYELLHNIEQKFPTLESFAEIFSGIKAYEVGKGKPSQTTDIKINKPYTSSQKIDKYWSPFLDGKHIGRYEMLWKENNWILYGEHLAAPRNASLFEGEKILIRKIIGDRLISHYVSDSYFCNTLLFILKLLPEEANISYLSLLGILNSRFIAWYFRKKFQISAEDTFPQIMMRDTLQFPIPNVANEFTQEIEYLAKKILSLKVEKTYVEVDDLEAQIDTLVYKLYDLTEEEIAIIEAKI